MKNKIELWYTEGPASRGKEKELLEAGATGVRLTFSFAEPTYHDRRAKFYRKLAKKLRRNFKIVADLPGEKYRLGAFPERQLLKQSETIRLLLIDTYKKDRKIFPVKSPNFFVAIRPNGIVTVGDGSIRLRIKSASSKSASAQVITAGYIEPNRGLAIQGAKHEPRALTNEDLDFLKHIAAGSLYDAVAISFTSSHHDIRNARKVLKNGGSSIPIIAKIENSLGIRNIKSICAESDYVMAARGDLALTTPWQELYKFTEEIALSAKKSHTPWILATQLAEGLDLFSMLTRAEISDVSHWVNEDCSGVMLSHETAFGKQPVEAVSLIKELL